MVTDNRYSTVGMGDPPWAQPIWQRGARLWCMRRTGLQGGPPTMAALPSASLWRGRQGARSWQSCMSRTMNGSENRESFGVFWANPACRAFFCRNRARAWISDQEAAQEFRGLPPGWRRILVARVLICHSSGCGELLEPKIMGRGLTLSGWFFRLAKRVCAEEWRIVAE